MKNEAKRNRVFLKSSFPADFDYIEIAGTVVRMFLERIERISFTDAQLFNVVRVINESCRNVVEHAYPDCGVGRMDISVEVRDEGVILEISDYGIGFDLEYYRSRSHTAFDSDCFSGLGLLIIEKLMDKVDYVSSDDKNSLILTIKLRGNATKK